jgi:mannose-6-phosphate isomerase-like protein (cupin superfamily)
MRRTFVLFLVVLSFNSCARSPEPRVFNAEGILPAIEWTAEEKAQTLSARKIRATREASYHLIRLGGAEGLHTHDHHDLTVVLISGKARITLGKQQFMMAPGDVMEVPKGTIHKAENLAHGGSEVYAIFTPPMEGKDHRVVDAIKGN